MTTTAMFLSGQRIQGGPSTRRRPTVSRPLIRPSRWVAPIVWMATVALIVTGAGVLALSRDDVPSGTPATIAVRVSPADTLWSIAQANRIPGATTAATVEVISRVNALRGRRLVPGSVLRVPVSVASDSALALADGGATVR